MPVYRRLPKRGFKNLKPKNIALINLSRIQELFLNKKILSTSKISLLNLKKSKLVNNKYKELKVLGSGDLKEKFDVETHYISKSAKEKIEKIGGKVILIK